MFHPHGPVLVQRVLADEVSPHALYIPELRNVGEEGDHLIAGMVVRVQEESEESEYCIDGWLGLKVILTK